MNHSKPGKKLTPELNAVILPIYRRDPRRYINICKFVWHQQSLGASDESIIKCVQLADSQLDLVGDWYAYLVKLMPKGSAKAHEDEAEQLKRGDMDLALQFVDFLKGKVVVETDGTFEKYDMERIKAAWAAVGLEINPQRVKDHIESMSATMTISNTDQTRGDAWGLGVIIVPPSQQAGVKRLAQSVDG